VAWIIQSISEGPVVINDIGLTLTKGQVRDLDLIGRENAERSNEVKILIMKGFLREVRKDPHSTPVGGAALDPKIVAALSHATEQMQQATSLAAAQGDVIQKLQEQNERLEQQLKHGHEQSAAIMEKATRILSEVQAFAERNPNEIKAIREAVENINRESAEISEKRAEIAKQASGGAETESELAAHDRILAIKEKKLNKNLGTIGKTVSKSADSIQDAINAMDELGIS
jgi:DNA repair exonuclease SbcCD ATPase subunit